MHFAVFEKAIIVLFHYAFTGLENVLGIYSVIATNRQKYLRKYVIE